MFVIRDFWPTAPQQFNFAKNLLVIAKLSRRVLELISKARGAKKPVLKSFFVDFSSLCNPQLQSYVSD